MCYNQCVPKRYTLKMAGDKMRITQEADYAIRICIILGSIGEKTGAADIAANACITQQFALKILRKLSQEGIVRSYKGAYGGYELSKHKDELTALEIIEAIDGKTYINKCLCCDEDCSRNKNKSECKMHIAFGAINKNLVDNLTKITIGKLTDENISSSDIVGLIK